MAGNVYTDLWTQYGTRDGEQKPRHSAARQLVDALRRDPIAGPEALRVTVQDRIIFMLFVFVAHLVTLYLVEWLVLTSAVRSFRQALVVMGVVYTGLLGVLACAVNMTDGDLRIVFNYLNQMTSSVRLYVHVGLLWFTIGIALLALSTTPATVAAVTASDRAAVCRKLEVVSATIWYTLAVLSVAL